MNVTPPDGQELPAAPRRRWSGVPRRGLLILGTLTVLGPIIAAFTVGGSERNTAGLIGMGLVLGIPMLVLGLLAQPAILAQSAALRTLISGALVCASAAVGGMIIHNLSAAVWGEAGLVAGMSFVVALLGIPLFLVTALVAIPLCAAQQWLRTHPR